MNTETITSPDSFQRYKLFIHNGRAVGCTCMHREKQPHVPCKHMTKRNTPEPEHYCQLCGYRTKGIFPVCWRCAGA